jgi:hypothetical protein
MMLLLPEAEVEKSVPYGGPLCHGESNERTTERQLAPGCTSVVIHWGGKCGATAAVSLAISIGLLIGDLHYSSDTPSRAEVVVMLQEVLKADLVLGVLCCNAHFLSPSGVWQQLLLSTPSTFGDQGQWGCGTHR